MITTTRVHAHTQQQEARVVRGGWIIGWKVYIMNADLIRIMSRRMRREGMEKSIRIYEMVMNRE